MNKLIYFRIVIVTAIIMMSVFGLRANNNEQLPKRVIFDTDLGNDIDDLLALEMLINYEHSGKVDLLGVGISKSNIKAFQLASAYYNLYGLGSPEFGIVSRGRNPDDGNYLNPVLASMKGEKKFPKAGEAWRMMRRLLADSPDHSVDFIAVGPLTNLSRLLNSLPDSISKLDGRKLVEKKVKQLTLMGGAYSENTAPEWNILQDIDAAKNVFENWGSPIVASGFEIGNQIKVSHQFIEENFVKIHPLRVAYEHFLTMPYDRPSWDLTAVLAAVDPECFVLSDKGKVVVSDKGETQFMPTKKGEFRCITSIKNDAEPLMLSSLKSSRIPKPARFNLATYNIRYLCDEDSLQGDFWSRRCPQIAEIIKFHDFNIFGTQEGQKYQLETLKEKLPGYDYIYGVSDNNMAVGEYLSIFYDTKLFEVDDSGSYFLSEMPDQPSKGWDAALPRICVWGKFRHRQSGRAFLMFNVHFDHWGKKARTESGRLILSKINDFGENLPVFLCGDFNVDQSSECYEFLNNSGVLYDSYDIAGFRHLPTGTFNKWKINGYSTSRIDHIFVSGDITVDKYGVFTDTYLTTDNPLQESLGMDGMYVKFLEYTQRIPSDHYPIRITVEL